MNARRWRVPTCRITLGRRCYRMENGRWQENECKENSWKGSTAGFGDPHAGDQLLAVCAKVCGFHAILLCELLGLPGQLIVQIRGSHQRSGDTWADISRSDMPFEFGLFHQFRWLFAGAA